jgi:integrase
MTLQETAEYLRLEFVEAESITKDTLASLLRRTEAAPIPKRGAGLDRRTVNYIHTILHRAFKDAVRWGRLARNPADAADPPKAGQKLDDMSTWDAETLLRAHRKRMLEERLMVGPDFTDRGYVFHQPDGNWLHPDAVSAQFLRRGAAYGLPRLILHGIRHTWATLALEQGIHPKVVQERLGHSTIAITLGIYSHVSPTLHDEAAETIAALVL